MVAAYAAATAAGVADRLARSRRDPDVVRLEGVHALKHAVRFGARLELVATPDRRALLALLDTLAPDVLATAERLAVELPLERWRTVVPRELPSPALSLAARPVVGTREVLAADGRVLVLDRSRHLGNLGAAVRVAAAAGAGGVLVVGDADPWHPTALRAGAGLQFALACARADALPDTGRPVVALDPTGTPLAAAAIPPDALVVVGTERGGLASPLLERADAWVAIPMRPGVSSLNLATAVAVALYQTG